MQSIFAICATVSFCKSKWVVVKCESRDIWEPWGNPSCPTPLLCLRSLKVRIVLWIVLPRASPEGFVSQSLGCNFGKGPGSGWLRQFIRPHQLTKLPTTAVAFWQILLAECPSNALELVNSPTVVPKKRQFDHKLVNGHANPSTRYATALFI